jgi:hypothetical protein
MLLQFPRQQLEIHVFSYIHYLLLRMSRQNFPPKDWTTAQQHSHHSPSLFDQVINVFVLLWRHIWQMLYRRLSCGVMRMRRRVNREGSSVLSIFFKILHWRPLMVLFFHYPRLCAVNAAEIKGYQAAVAEAGDDNISITSFLTLMSRWIQQVQ